MTVCLLHLHKGVLLKSQVPGSLRGHVLVLWIFWLIIRVPFSKQKTALYKFCQYDHQQKPPFISSGREGFPSCAKNAIIFLNKLLNWWGDCNFSRKVWKDLGFFQICKTSQLTWANSPSHSWQPWLAAGSHSFSCFPLQSFWALLGKRERQKRSRHIHVTHIQSTVKSNPHYNGWVTLNYSGLSLHRHLRAQFFILVVQNIQQGSI